MRSRDGATFRLRAQKQASFNRGWARVRTTDEAVLERGVRLLSASMYELRASRTKSEGVMRAPSSSSSSSASDFKCRSIGR